MKKSGLISSIKELRQISKNQVKEYNFRGVLECFNSKEEITSKIEELGLTEKDCTVLSMVDDEGRHYFVYQGYRWANCIGYFLLIGNYTIDDCLSSRE